MNANKKQQADERMASQEQLEHLRDLVDRAIYHMITNPKNGKVNASAFKLATDWLRQNGVYYERDDRLGLHGRLRVARSVGGNDAADGDDNVLSDLNTPFEISN